MSNIEKLKRHSLVGPAELWKKQHDLGVRKKHHVKIDYREGVL